jgi:L-aspartate oxidase
MVFGPRSVDAIDRGVDGPEPTGAMRAVLQGEGVDDGVIGGRPLALDLCFDEGEPVTRDELQRGMSEHAGVLRTAASLVAAATLARRPAAAGDDPVAAAELRNLQTVGQAVVAGALAREETRGAHARGEFPEKDGSLALRFVVSA